MLTKYRGRIQITREVIAALLHLPQDISIDIYHNYEQDVYEILMRSNHEIESLTTAVTEGEIIPIMPYKTFIRIDKV